MTIIPRPVPPQIYKKRCPLCLKLFKSISQLSLVTQYHKHIIECREKELKEFKKEHYGE